VGAEAKVFPFDAVGAVASYFMQGTWYYLLVHWQTIGKYLFAIGKQQGFCNSFEVVFGAAADFKIHYPPALPI